MSNNLKSSSIGLNKQQIKRKEQKLLTDNSLEYVLLSSKKDHQVLLAPSEELKLLEDKHPVKTK